MKLFENLLILQFNRNYCHLFLVEILYLCLILRLTQLKVMNYVRP